MTNDQAIATENLKIQIERTGQVLNSLLIAWQEYEDAFGGIQAPVENYPFDQSLDEVAFAALGMTLADKAGA
jgi:hypothetical protein